jgi:hypothetical protein
MGQQQIKLEKLSTEKKATSLLRPSLPQLQRDWARALGNKKFWRNVVSCLNHSHCSFVSISGQDVTAINWKKTQINFDQFRILMEPSWSDRDIRVR